MGVKKAKKGKIEQQNARFKSADGLFCRRHFQADPVLQALAPVPSIHSFVGKDIDTQSMALVALELAGIHAAVGVALLSTALRFACLPFSFIVRTVGEVHRSDAVSLPT